jgi:hypothetical protein
MTRTVMPVQEGIPCRRRRNARLQVAQITLDRYGEIMPGAKATAAAAKLGAARPAARRSKVSDQRETG